MTIDEIYPNPPVALALIEVKHPSGGPLTSAALSLLKQTLTDLLPIQRTEESLEFNVQTGDRRSSKFTRFVSRDLHTSASYRDDSVVVESTAYESWTWLLALLNRAMHARSDVGALDGLERVGLRYVNEVRVPDADPRWRDWVRDGLVGPIPKESGLELSLRERQGVSVFEGAQPNETVTLRYTSGVGQAVISTPNLTRPVEGEGKYFLLDIDSVWLPGKNGVPEYNEGVLGEILARLHGYANDLFEFCISDKLREEVLRK